MAHATGLPLLPGILRYDEVAYGEITRGLRFTVPKTGKVDRYRVATLTGLQLPPIGQRFRQEAATVSRYFRLGHGSRI